MSDVSEDTEAAPELTLEEALDVLEDEIGQLKMRGGDGAALQQAHDAIRKATDLPSSAPPPDVEPSPAPPLPEDVPPAAAAAATEPGVNAPSEIAIDEHPYTLDEAAAPVEAEPEMPPAE